MRDRNAIRYAASFAAAVCVLAAAVLMVVPAAPQVVDFGKYPDLKGSWIRADRGQATTSTTTSIRR